MSHRNLNIFASFNEWISLKEQKKYSVKGPSGNNFCGEKKHQQKFHWAVVPEQFYSDMHSSTVQYPFPFFPSLQGLTIGKMISASSSNLTKPSCSISYSNHNIHPQIRTDSLCNHFNYISLLHTNQPTKQVHYHVRQLFVCL